MKKCPFCNAEIEEKARFCIYCMSSLNEKQIIKAKIERKNNVVVSVIAAILAFAIIGTSLFFINKKSASILSADLGSSVLGSSSPSSSYSQQTHIVSLQSSETQHQQSFFDDSEKSASSASSTSHGAATSGSTVVSNGSTSDNVEISSNQSSTNNNNSSEAASSNPPQTEKSDIEEYLVYQVKNSKVTIVNCEKSIAGDIKIPETIAGYPVTSIESGAFIGCASLTSITIPEGVTNIGENAFYGCTGLKSITIPNSVTFIFPGAFQGCNSVEKISVPFIGYSRTATGGGTVFGTLFGFTIINKDSEDAPADSIVQYTEYNGEALYCYFIPKSIREVVITDTAVIPNNAFSKCYFITSITIPNSVTSIGNYAFSGCSSLNDVWYGGYKSDKEKISIGKNNEHLKNATWHLIN